MAENNLTITATAVDQASGPLKAAAQEFANMAAQVANSDQQLVNSAKQLTEHHRSLQSEIRGTAREFGHATEAISMLGGSGGEATKMFAEVGSRATQLAGVLATGGALGIAIAGAGALIAAGAAIWETYQQQEEAAAKATANLKGLFDAQAKAVADSAKRVEEADRALRNFGLTANQIKLRDLGNDQDRLAKGTQLTADEMGKVAAETEKQAAAYKIYEEHANAILEAHMNDLRTEHEMREIAEALQKSTGMNVADTRQMIEMNRAQIAAFQQTASAIKQQSDDTVKLKQDTVDLDALERRRDNAARQRQSDQQAYNQLLAEYDRKQREMGMAILKQIADEKKARTEAVNAEVAEFLRIEEKKDEERKRDIEKDRTHERQRLQLVASVATGISDAWAQAAIGIAAGSESAGRATMKAVLESARVTIMAMAAQAAASAFAANAMLPVVGIAVGTAAASAAFGIAENYLSQLPAFADGGLVTGGIAGRDSVPALLMPGERVLSVQQNKDYEGGGHTFIINAHFAGLPRNKAEAHRFFRDHVVGPLQDLAMNGAFKLPARAVRP